ncbi:MAG TPA: hypothetical protein VMT17_02225 [Anaeromyxobacteraceae bacterium]|nr:hypothetical protein [Anaeromyxobacteraceae bacterium]
MEVEKLSGFHWSSTESHIGLPSPRPMIHAFVWCDDAPRLLHPKILGECPHRIKVCIVKKIQEPRVFDALKALADQGKAQRVAGADAASVGLRRSRV